MAVDQALIDELVDRFYDKLMKETYFQQLFAERNVDLEHLKQRQRVFLRKLAEDHDSEEDTDTVYSSHRFDVQKEGSEIWMNLMEETIREVNFPEKTKETLIKNIKFLVNQLLKK